jgi:RimJ/RimL family protein N-acetyltransferase
MSPIPEPPIVNLEGDLVALGPLRRDLAASYARWMNDFEVMKNMGAPVSPVTAEQQATQYERLATPTETDRNFLIYEKATWLPIGTTALHEISHYHRRATFVIIIGEAAGRGRGYGTETARLMLDYAFSALGLTNVMLKVFEYNAAGMRAYLKAGFTEFGRRHQSHAMGGRLWDEIYMECRAVDFTSPVLARRFGLEP